MRRVFYRAKFNLYNGCRFQYGDQLKNFQLPEIPGVVYFDKSSDVSIVYGKRGLIGKENILLIGKINFVPSALIEMISPAFTEQTIRSATEFMKFPVLTSTILLSWRLR